MSYQRKSKEDVQAEVKALAEQATEQVKKFETSFEARREFFDFMTEMYNYSPKNQMLIQSQYDGALGVAPFGYWKKEGFSVQKGEKGIKIFVPKTVSYFKNSEGITKQLSKATPNEKIDIQLGRYEVTKQNYFSVGSVFDITQTNAKPEDYPKIYPNRPYELNIEDPKQIDAIEKGLLSIAKSRDIPVYNSQREYPGIELGAAKGVFFTNSNGGKGIVISDRINQTERLAVLTHELAHAALHDPSELNKNGYWSTHDLSSGRATNVKELQAEMVSYVVSKHHGLDTSEAAIPYIQSWTEDIKDFDKNADVFKDIQVTSQDFIKQIDESMARSQSKANVQTNSKEALAR